MRILIVSQWFTPEPILKGLPFAKGLAARGHQVEVLTGFPNYPGGVVYPGYRIRFFQRERMDGISVTRVPLYPSHDRSSLHRIWNYVSFALAAAVFGVLLPRKPDVIYAYHPPATIAFPALLIGKLRRAPVVYDIQDLWPDTLRATQMVRDPSVLSLVERWCRMTYRCARKIVVLSPGFKEALVQRGVPDGKIDVIYNWTIEESVVRKPRNQRLARELGMAGKFNIVFAGTMGKAQGLETVIEAAEALQARLPHLQVVLAGGGVEQERLKSLALEKKLSNVLFLPYRPVSEMTDVLNLADVFLVHLQKDPLFRITIPSKVQAYLAMGRPILVGVEGDTADLVLKAGAGFAYDPGSSEALALLMERVAGMSDDALSKMGACGCRYYQTYLSCALGVEQFERTFQEVTGSRAPRRAYRLFFKRAVDILGASVLLTLCSPVLLLIAGMVKVSFGSPVFFRQERPGLQGRPFRIFKFRTLTNDTDDTGELLPDEARATRVGRWIRSTSLDELPELLNVLKGDMSLVGPRPLLMHYLPLYSPEQERRHDVKPGITGWAQVNGRNDLPWETRLAMDVWYVDHLSFALDLRILLWTVGKVLRREGVAQAGHFSAPEFQGSHEQNDSLVK